MRQRLVDKEQLELDAEQRRELWAKNAVEGLDVPMCFPPAVRFAGNCTEEQLAQVVSEARELVDAMCEPEGGAWLIEAMDLHHSLETLWRLLTNQYGPEVVNNVRAMVIQKNAERGYYVAADPATLDG